MSESAFPAGQPEPVDLSPGAKRRNILPVVAMAVAVLLVVGVVAGVLLTREPKAASAAERLAAAPAAAQEAGSFNFSASVEAKIGGGTGTAGGTGRSTQLGFTGAVDPATGRSSIDMSSILPGAKIVTDGTYAYLPVAESARTQTGGKPFVRFDAASLADVGGGMGAGSATSPMQTLEQLKTVDAPIDRVGEEKVRGVDSTHFRTTLDLTKAAGAELPTEPEAAALLEQLRRVPTDVWLDDEDRPVRYTMQMTIDPGTGMGTVATNVTLEFFDYGKAAAVEVPDATQAFDADVEEALGLLVGPQLSGLLPKATS